jgi:hypothetical protein
MRWVDERFSGLWNLYCPWICAGGVRMFASGLGLCGKGSDVRVGFGFEAVDDG